MAKNKIFSNNSNNKPYVSKYYSKKGKQLQKSRKIIKSGTETSGNIGHARYTAIMDSIPKEERDHARDTYGSDEVFVIGDYMAENNAFYEEAQKYYDEKISNELDELLKGI